jgi:hypothetical protein
MTINTLYMKTYICILWESPASCTMGNPLWWYHPDTKMPDNLPLQRSLPPNISDVTATIYKRQKWNSDECARFVALGIHFLTCSYLSSFTLNSLLHIGIMYLTKHPNNCTHISWILQHNTVSPVSLCHKTLWELQILL